MTFFTHIRQRWLLNRSPKKTRQIIKALSPNYFEAFEHIREHLAAANRDPKASQETLHNLALDLLAAQKAGWSPYSVFHGSTKAYSRQLVKQLPEASERPDSLMSEIAFGMTVACLFHQGITRLELGMILACYLLVNILYILLLTGRLRVSWVQSLIAFALSVGASWYLLDHIILHDKPFFAWEWAKLFFLFFTLVASYGLNYCLENLLLPIVKKSP